MKTDNRVFCAVRLEPEKHRRLKAKAAREGIKLQELLERLVDEYLKGAKK